MTKREAILDRLQEIIEAVTYGVDGDLDGRVFRSRKVAISRQETPAIVLEPLRDDPTNQTIHRLIWRLIVRVSFVVRGDVPDQAADPIIEAVHAAIMADISLGGLSNEIEPGSVSYEFLDADGGGGVIPVDYAITYQTSRESMTDI